MEQEDIDKIAGALDKQIEQNEGVQTPKVMPSVTAIPPVTPTLKAVLDTAESVGVRPTVDMNTAAGQTQLADTAKVGSQPSSNKPVSEQLQGTRIRSAAFDDEGNLLRPLTDDEILTLPHIHARSFNYSGDEIKVLAINHNYILRWVQCGDYKGAGTNWLARQIGLGFTYAIEEDIRPEYREKFKKDDRGHYVIPPDLTLMKMSAMRYYQFIKGNMVESLDRVSDKGAKNRAKAKALAQMRGEAPGGNLDLEESKAGLPQGGSKRFTGDIVKDKFSFYDPMAGR